jgi:alpha-tubulin suppressor-like RCC1 family protein
MAYSGTVIASQDNVLYMSGRNDCAQFGTGHSGERTNRVPVAISLPSKSSLKMVASGFFHSLALMEDGQVFGWGHNVGQLANASPGRYRPTLLPIPSKTVYVAVCEFCSFCVQEDGSLYVFGQQTRGELGLGLESPSMHATPQHVVLPGGAKAVQVACGKDHTLVVTHEGEVYGSGSNEKSQLGLGDDSDHASFSLLKFPKPGTKISAVTCTSNRSSFALTTEGEIYAWGHNADGLLGLGHVEDRSTPQLVQNFPGRALAITCGFRHALALTEGPRGRSIYLWGGNMNGQLGFRGVQKRLFPTRLPLPSSSSIVSIASGYCHSVVFCKEEVLAWGCNAYGELGEATSAVYQGTPLILPRPTWRIQSFEWRENWRGVARWIFLGMSCPDSEFSELPVEVVFHLTMVMDNW